MDRYYVPGVSVARLVDGEIERRHWGVARDAESVDDQTRFLAGSASKAVFGVVALCAVRDGLVSLDAPIHERLRSWAFPDSNSGSRVTLRHLLSHTAGLTLHGYFGYRRGSAIPSLAQSLRGDPPSNSGAVQFAFEPGTQMLYSGGGFTVAQLLLESITDKPLSVLAAELLFEPLGMRHSSFENPPPTATHASLASGHHSSGAAVAGDWFIYPESAAAGLWTTATDLCLLLRAVCSSIQTSDGILPQPLAAEMTTPQVGGRGLGVDLQPGANVFAHSGADQGFQAMLAGRTDRSLGIAVMTNSDNGLPLFGPLSSAALAE